MVQRFPLDPAITMILEDAYVLMVHATPAPPSSLLIYNLSEQTDTIALYVIRCKLETPVFSVLLHNWSVTL